MMDEQKARTHQRFEKAVTDLTELLQRDRTVLAAILGGSLANDEVWEKSDIDLLIIGDETHKSKSFTLTEEGVNIHAWVLPRSGFKKMVEGSLQNSFMHSYLSKSRLLYTHDESLYPLFEGLQKVGERDRGAQLLRMVPAVLWALPKAEKWFYVKHDMRYSFLFILYCVNALAPIEVISHGKIAGREAIQQALLLNPDFFQKVYTELIDGPKDEAAIGDALARINDYLTARADRIFQPILEYLREEGGPRSASEIDFHFKNIVQSEGISNVCEWLSEKGIIEKLSLPVRLSPRSQVAVNEVAYYYDGDR